MGPPCRRLLGRMVSRLPLWGSWSLGKLIQTNAEMNAQNLASLGCARLPGESRGLDENVDDARVEGDACASARLEVVLISGRAVNVGGRIELIFSVDLGTALDSHWRQ